MDTYHATEKFERKFVDKFFTYGWSDSRQTIPMPMAKTLDEKLYNCENTKILLASQIAPLYLLRFNNFPMSAMNLNDHVEFPLKFLRKTNFLNDIEIRYPIIEHNGWNNVSLIKKEFLNIKIDKSKLFYESLKNSKIFISDHLGTSFLEALQFNIPSIIFINKNSYSYRKEFYFYLNKLVSNKVVFYNPENASIFLNEVYMNIDEWWFSDNIQNLRLEICNKYALTSNTWQHTWSKTLKP
jgi:putative transferase (TIGR04331 family)